MLDIVCKYLNVKFRYSRRKRFFLYKRLISGIEIEKIVILLEDEVSEIKMNSVLTKLTAIFNFKNNRNNNKLQESYNSG